MPSKLTELNNILHALSLGYDRLFDVFVDTSNDARYIGLHMPVTHDQ